ncbi:MAG: DUF2442 domain-containing protein [Vulcanimicrobiaceae bacterium]
MANVTEPMSRHVGHAPGLAAVRQQSSSSVAREPILGKVGYAPSRDVVKVQLTTGALVEIPRSAIEELRGLTEAQLRALKVDNAGMTISQRSLNIDIYLPGLLADLFGVNPGALLGKKGGAKTSDAKRRAARKNGRSGGRPKKRAPLKA